jgi:hypothetical protein
MDEELDQNLRATAEAWLCGDLALDSASERWSKL